MIRFEERKQNILFLHCYICSAESIVEVVGSLEVVNVARFVKALSQEHRRPLLIGISKVKDKRTTRATGTNDGKTKLHIDTVKDSSFTSRNPVTHASIALKQAGFKDTMAEVLGHLVMELIQDVAKSKSFE